jgi:hypothetical protein
MGTNNVQLIQWKVPADSHGSCPANQFLKLIVLRFIPRGGFLEIPVGHGFSIPGSGLNFSAKDLDVI